MLQLPLNIHLNAAARLSNFYVANNHQLFQRLEQFHQSSGDFLFVWGPEQRGKSHLAQGICQNYSEKGFKTVYIPLDNPSLIPAVLDGLEVLDMVCLDSLQSVSQNNGWQQAIFNLFNRLKNKQKQLLIFCRDSAKNVKLTLADLKSRLNSMEIYKLEALNEPQQKEFLIASAKHAGLQISTETAQFILARVSREMNDLVGIIHQLDHQSLAQKRKVTVPFVKKVLNL